MWEAGNMYRDFRRRRWAQNIHSRRWESKPLSSAGENTVARINWQNIKPNRSYEAQ